ncbi:MAG: prepilin-type N-terminal cleavage/methylation domain-containing protein [Armatimonadetes bacterium]|nr:prepilin-type N-terminal cleavage/methylation domain-containing protein [Armatimonadota bacterium]
MKAFTLIEVLVASFIALLLSGIIYAILALTLNYWKVLDTKNEVQLNALVGINKMREEMTYSSIYSFTENSASFPKAVSFQIPYYQNNFQTDLNGNAQYIYYVIYYLLSKNSSLIRRAVYQPGPVSPLTSAQLINYCDGTGDQKAFYIDDFNINIAPPLVKLTLASKNLYSNKINNMEIYAEIYPKN